MVNIAKIMHTNLLSFAKTVLRTQNKFCTAGWVVYRRGLAKIILAGREGFLHGHVIAKPRESRPRNWPNILKYCPQGVLYGGGGVGEGVHC